METAGSLRGGRYVWGLANLGKGFTLKNNDEVKGYLLVGSPHEQGKSLIIKFTSVRVVCNNTLTLALRGKGNEFRMSHRVAFDNDTMNRAKDVLGIARDQVGEFEKNAKTLQKIRISNNDAIKILAGVFAPDADVKELVNDFDANGTPRLKALMGAYSNAPGAEVGTGWGLLNATTYYADHMASRTPDKRLANAWLGKTANQKERVLDTLLQMA
jgi:phage/plasmid-like protein (TIGR03299 family)